MKNFLYRLFFTRNDDLDILQLLFATVAIIAIIITWNIAMTPSNADAVRIESLITLRYLLGLLVISAVPKWMTKFYIVKSPPLD
jgi:hypothetical protein